MSTIYDIAEKVGLSSSTVARALSGKGYCSRDAQERVLRAAKELRYVPVQAAKSLKSKITHKIMLCIPDILNPYYFSMIDGVNEVLESYQYHMILVYTNHNPQKELRIIESLQERFVDGLIIVSFDFSDALLRAIRDAGVPAVLTNDYSAKYGGQFDCVYVNHTRATYLATECCVQNGHKRIAFLCGDLREQTGRERLAGYRLALEESNIPFDEELLVPSDYTIQGGYRSMTGFLEGKQPFSAVVSCNDLMGIGCINACREHGLRLTGDFSLATLDNTDYCLCTNPQLTSVNMMQDQIGRNAARLIMEQVNGEKNYRQTMILTPELVLRDSVKRV